nr:hypothetical protein B0A51_05845 [Rachicladosporium sp. CCFEE 5018]
MAFRGFALATIGLVATAHAQVSTQCQGDVCYSLSIPQTSSSSNIRDIYFRIAAPKDYQWVALGQGSEMDGAQMFVMYQSANGQNVTVSPRNGEGHNTPEYNGNSQLTLLEGSGVLADKMVANVRCSNCSSWRGGNMDFSSSAASWIYANKFGYPIQSDDLNAGIQQHGNAYGTWSWDFATARGSNSVNPFLETSVITPTVINNSKSRNTVLVAHGVMASLAFLVVFPIGGILVRVANFSGLVWVHAGLQMLAWLIYLVAFCMGVWLATNTDDIKKAHPVIGIALFLVLLVQPVLGWMHHKMFKEKRTRTAWSWTHIGIGRLAILVGMINGGLGLQLAGDTEKKHVVPYAIVGLVFGLAYIGAIVWGELKRRRNRPNAEYKRQGNELHNMN